MPGDDSVNICMTSTFPAVFSATFPFKRQSASSPALWPRCFPSSPWFLPLHQWPVAGRWRLAAIMNNNSRYRLHSDPILSLSPSLKVEYWWCYLDPPTLPGLWSTIWTAKGNKAAPRDFVPFILPSQLFCIYCFCLMQTENTGKKTLKGKMFLWVANSLIYSCLLLANSAFSPVWRSTEY